jgi:hypothetical protein
MMSAVGINGVLGFVMLVTLCFTLGDITEVLATPTGYPFIQIFFNTTQSYSATNVLVAILIITLTASTISEVATASRQLWSFARDQGLPFSSSLAYVRRHFISIFFFFSVVAVKLIPPGNARLEHPPQCRPGFPRRHRPSFSHKHRVNRRPTSHRLPHHFLPGICLYHLHRLRPAEAHPWRTSPRAPLDARPLRHGHQYRRAHVPVADIRVCLLPPGYARREEHYELEHRHV